MRGLLGIILVCSVLFFSCTKQDSPYVLPPRGDAQFETLNMGEDYRYQFYYNLESKQVVHISAVKSWDLKFESSFAGDKVFINGGKGLAVIPTNSNHFFEIDASYCLNRHWNLDNPNYGAESSVFGDWSHTLNYGKVFVVRLDNMANEMKKLKLKSVTNFGYVIEVADINSAVGTEFFIEKEPHSNYTYFNLNLLQKVLDVEPIPEVWDILFTRYGHTFNEEDPPLPYSVTGVLLNPMGTLGYKDSTRDFYSIDKTILNEINLNSNLDAIGFDWKYYDIDQAVYTVNQHYNFIIRTKEEDYYKLRFTSFYSDAGIKGSPSFEFAQIK